MYLLVENEKASNNARSSENKKTMKSANKIFLVSFFSKI